MTGIERLRTLAGAWDEWGLGGTLAEMADQIERELRDERDRWESDLYEAEVAWNRVAAVCLDMERHVSGVEGAEDSPVARWARELREALGGAVTDEDRDAAAWVRERGGIDYVKKEWRSRVPRDRYERRRQSLLGHIAECEAALGRRREIISELSHRVSDLTRENAELRRRAMPEGYEWPRYESGEPVGFGDEASRLGEVFEVSAICLYRDGSYALNFRAYSKDERVKRPAPKVLAADGEPLEVGQTVWDENGDELVVGALEDGGHTVTCRYADVGDGIPVHGMWSPSDLTHQRPVLDADGVPIKKGDTVYWLEHTAPFTVVSPHETRDNAGQELKCGHTVEVMRDGHEPHMYVHPESLHHTKPEHPKCCRDCAHWQKDPIADKMGVCWFFYHEHEGQDCYPARLGDIGACEEFMPRASALAERERGE